MSVTKKLFEMANNFAKFGVNYYNGNINKLDVIRSTFKTLGEGTIALKLNNSTGIAELMICQPKHKNAITGKMMVDFEDAVDKLENWKTGKGVLIYGSEGNFCSGGDLDFAYEITFDMKRAVDSLWYMHSILDKLQKLPLISVAFINGIGAIGGGAEIAISCDFRLMTTEDKTGIVFIHNKLGLTPSWGGCGRLINLIGKTKALNVILSRKCINADEGINLGVVDGVAETIEDAETWLHQRTLSDSSVIRSTKYLVLNSNDKEVACRLSAALWGTELHKNNVEQFIRRHK